MSIAATKPDAGDLVRSARQRSGLSQAEVARRASTSQAAISRIERGLEQPTMERLGQILAGLGWRARIELEPIAEHDAEPRRLHEDAAADLESRVRTGRSMQSFASRYAGVASR